MKSIKQEIAVFLAALLMMPNMPVRVQGAEPEFMESVVPDVVQYNTGNGVRTISPFSYGMETVTGAAVEEGDFDADDFFSEDGSYTIQIPEVDPFFPYEVQFTYDGNVTNEWFMTPEDSVEIGGHKFYVTAEFTGTVVTQMSFCVAGDTVTVYPEEKEFPEYGVSGYSLLPLEEKTLRLDLTSYTPMELSMVKIREIFAGQKEFTDTDKIIWTDNSSGDNYVITTPEDTIDMYYCWSYQMIIGSDDQLNMSNIRYRILVETTDSHNDLITSIYIQNEDGTRKELTIMDIYDYYARMTISKAELGDASKIYFGLQLNAEKFSNAKFDYIKAYEGYYISPEDAIASNKDITDQIWEVDMSQSDSGYSIELQKDYNWNTTNITLITFDVVGNVTGFKGISFEIYINSFSWEWLNPIIYTQDSDGKRMKVTIKNKYCGEGMDCINIHVPEKEIRNDGLYVGLERNQKVFPDLEFDHFKVYEGKFETLEDVMNGKDITEQIWEENMEQNNKGYFIKLKKDQNFIDPNITLTFVTFDAEDHVTGFKSVELRISIHYGEIYSYDITDEKGNSIITTDLWELDGDKMIAIGELLAEYRADANYCLRMEYYDSYEKSNNNLVLHAYVGDYDNIDMAVAAGAKDIRDELFGRIGYEANYSKMVDFTIFVQENDAKEGDATIIVKHFSILLKDGNLYRDERKKNDLLYFTGLRNGEGESINCYIADIYEDSYAEYNYLTIVVEGDVNLCEVAPLFRLKSGAKLYAKDADTPEESGESFHDFSNGSIQYTVATEDGSVSKNYWLQIIKPTIEGNSIYINSLADTESKTEGIHSTREIMMDRYHDNVHDILLLNMGTSAIEGATVELNSDVLELDDYWTLKGQYDLSGFDGIDKKTQYGELANMAKLRLRVRDGVPTGTDINGTLTIKSATQDLLVLTLTGMTGNPVITTTEIPEAVKYVPYGTMIQNNNKYGWNQVSYSISDGELPEGMILKPNGELYGVPKETGTFHFQVYMTNDGNLGSDYKDFTLEIKENTDENVDNATDEGYDVTTRIEDIYLEEERQDQIFVSQGEFSEFVDVYLDGERLERDRDYKAESGSTRITIMAETLDEGLDEGTHTVGVEFRSEEDDSLKRAAQNFDVRKRSSIEEPSVTPEPSATATPVPEPTSTPKPTVMPTLTPIPEPSTMATPTPIPEPSTIVTPTPIPEPSTMATPTPNPTVTPRPTTPAIFNPEPVITSQPTMTPTPEPTATPQPTAMPTASAMPEPTVTPQPTASAIPEPTAIATPIPTNTPVPTRTEEAEPDSNMPFIKTNRGIFGWDAILALLQKASDGERIVVDMNDATMVPGTVIEEIADRDVTICLEFTGNITWEINGNSVVFDEIRDIDFQLLTGEDANEIPVDIVNRIVNERGSVNLTLVHNGEFGFTAILCISLGKKNAGFYANLFYYDEANGRLEFICADQIDEAGIARLAFTHASDYVIVLGDRRMDENAKENETNNENHVKEEAANPNDKDLPRTALKDSVWFFFMGMLILLVGGAVLFISYDKT